LIFRDVVGEFNCLRRRVEELQLVSSISCGSLLIWHGTFVARESTHLYRPIYSHSNYNGGKAIKCSDGLIIALILPFKGIKKFPVALEDCA